MDFSIEAQRKYIRIPFKTKGRDFSGCDCGGLVWLVYKNELGIELPDWRDMYSGTRIENSLELEETVSTVLGENAVEVDLKDAEPFDVVSFRIKDSSMHVGLVINKHIFFHIMEGYTKVVAERFSNPQWRGRVTGCFRHAAMFSK